MTAFTSHHRLATPDIPPHIQTAWLRQCAIDWPDWQPDDQDWRLAGTALTDFFDVCARNHDQACALPSRAADSIWHVWLDVDPAGLDAWQIQRHGRVFPHRENDALRAPLDASLARTFVTASRLGGTSPVKGSLPRLFTIDRWVSVPTGWAYARRMGTVQHRSMDDKGRPCGLPIRHQALMPAALLALALIDRHEVRMSSAARRDNSDGGSSGSACGTSCGCSCGSSCGSGCGD